MIELNLVDRTGWDFNCLPMSMVSRVVTDWTPDGWIGSKWNKSPPERAETFLKNNGGNLAVSSRTRWRTPAAKSNPILCAVFNWAGAIT
jgi:hypothetical protein